METVFISYARKEGAFVRRLHDALKKRGRQAWVDWEGIPPTDKWLATIHSAIEEADAFLFIISPDSVASKVCGVELDHAITQHKRLIPVVHHDVEAGTVRHELSELNYIFARESDSLDAACDELITALDTDLEWVRAHTRLLVRAVEWDREDSDPSYALRGRDLKYFEEWLAKSPDKEPKPTTLQSEYLLASRRTVTRRQRIVGGSVAVGLSIAVGLGTIAYFQDRERARQETIGGALKLVNRADALRDGPVDTVEARGRLEESTRAATRALATLDGLGIPSFDAKQAVRKSYAALPKWIDVALEVGPIAASAFDPTGVYLAVFYERQHLMIWDTARRRRTGRCTLSLAAMESAVAVAVGGDGALAATAVYKATKAADATEITVWSMADCSHRLRVQIPGRRDRIALGGNGEYLIVHDGSTLRLWEVASKSELSRDFADIVSAFAPSPDGRQLATIERNRGERRYWMRIRDLDGARALREWELPKPGYLGLQWGPSRLVASRDNTALIYDPDSGKLLHRHSIEKGKFALSRDGRIIAAPIKNHIIQIVDVATGTEVARSSHENAVANLAFSPDGRSLITLDVTERWLRVWLFESDGAFAALRDDEPIKQIRFSESGSLLYTATDQGVSSWQLPLPGEAWTSRRQAAPDAAAELSGRYRTEFLPATNPGDDAMAIAVHAADAVRKLPTIALDGPALAASVSRDGKRLAVIVGVKITRGGYMRRLEVWNVESETQIATREYETTLDRDMAAFLRFAGDDRYLVVGTRAGVEIVTADQLTPVAPLYHKGIRLVAMQNDGTIAATTGRNGIVSIWETAGGDEIARITSTQSIRALALSNDDRWLATLADTGTVRLWALSPGDLIHQACRWMVEPCP